MAVTIFGVRHHGPGCARSLRRALDELRPEAVVMEGPPDAEGILAWVTALGMKPPVAILVYPPGEPRRAVYYPLARFSPEWQALAWAAANKVPLRFMDLPQWHQLLLPWTKKDGAVEVPEEDKDPQSLERSKSADDPAQTDDQPARNGGGAYAEQPPVEQDAWQTDPLALLAEAAGYKEHELWWEEQVERRTDATGLFAAIFEAMRGVRDQFPEVKPKDLLREAYMRKTLRGVLKEGAQNVAVVCGAWHAPVLDTEALAGKRAGCKIKDDNERLSGLPKVKTTATWIPWTYSRLTFRSGYGAGIQSPGWYAHLWESNDDAPTRWLTTAARLLRAKDLDASSADVIEARRLADALAAMREIRSPGLAELNEAILTVMCHGEPAPLELIRVGLEIGDVLGEVPGDAPSVPLALDLAAQQSALRLKPSTEIKRLDLDLRKPNDLARSRLLHRLSALEIAWGRHERTTAKTSTFHELWTLQWTPEFAIAIIEANIWGNTVEAAATAKIANDAQAGSDLSALTSLLETAIVAGLDAAIDPLLDQIEVAAAAAADVRHLMNSLPPMARVARYGDVRGTKAAHVEPIFRRMLDRALVGIAAACSALDDDAAQRMLESMSSVSEALQTLSRDDLASDWRDCLDRLMRKSIHPLVCGWCCRLLLDAGALKDDELYRLARLALSPANPPGQSAAWATGLLRGSGLALLHQDALWQVFDRWLLELNAATFIEMLPLLRRAFAGFTGPERRQMGEKVKHLRSTTRSERAAAASRNDSSEIDHERASRVLPVLARIIGSH
jgi:Family of unknown function (DUF5682)